MMQPAGARSTFSVARGLVVICAALILAFAIIRNACVPPGADTEPGLGARFWPEHPTILRHHLLSLAGAAAATGQSAHDLQADLYVQLLRDQPLAIEPLLAAALDARSAGNAAKAETLLKVASRHDPRALAPRYFLAETYIASGRGAAGLRELVALSRFAPGGLAALPPFLAAYAHDPANRPQIAALIASDPALGDEVLKALAADPANAETVLALAPKNDAASRAMWLPALIDSQIRAGRYAEARSFWARSAGVAIPPGLLVNDPQFGDRDSPPPFGWQFAQGTLGLGERTREGAHVIFYGNESGSLIRQLLVLNPGTYRLSVASGGGSSAQPQALAWSLACQPSGKTIASGGFTPSRPFALDFTVTTGCPAQWLSLDGKEQDIGGQIDFRIAKVMVERLGGAK